MVKLKPNFSEEPQKSRSKFRLGPKRQLLNKSTMDSTDTEEKEDADPRLFSGGNYDIIGGETDSTSYVNASYIYEKLSSEPSFICCQAPKEDYLFKFWKMIWQEQVFRIFCLTNLRENGKILATQYWPNSQKKKAFISSDPTEKYFFKVVCVSEESSPFYVKRVLELKLLEKITETKSSFKDKRLIIHYQTVGWNDNKAPDGKHLSDFKTLVDLCISYQKKFKKPVLVHCR